MNPSSRVRVGVCLSLALFLPACAEVGGIFVKQSAGGLSRVDGVLEHVESVHVEAVLCRERMHESVEALQVLVSPDFGGNALQSFTRFEDSVDRSQTQWEALRDAAEPMRYEAQQVFADWTNDIAAFASKPLAQRSQARLEETRSRFKALSSAITPAQNGLRDVNLTLQDMALFLRHDFNASAVAEIRDQVAQLALRVLEIDAQFVAAQEAATVFVREGALRGQIVLSRSEPEPLPPLAAPQPEPEPQPAIGPAPEPEAEPTPAPEPSDPVYGPELPEEEAEAPGDRDV